MNMRAKQSMNQKLRKRYYAMLVLVAFAMNALLPNLSVYKSAAEQIADTNMVLICSSGGLKWAALADLQADNEHPEIQYELKLPAIASATHMLKDFVVLPVYEVAFATFAKEFLAKVETVESFTTAEITGNLHSRAPPCFA
jgi:hypothetical protein